MRKDREDRVRLLETDEDREEAEVVAAKKSCMTTKKQICFAVLLCITLLLMVVIISAEFSVSFSFSADSKKIKLGSKKFFPEETEEDGARAFDMPDMRDMPVFSDSKEDRYPEERKLMTDQKEFRMMADWLTEQQRLHGGHIWDFLPEHLKYLAQDPDMHKWATSEPVRTTAPVTTPLVTTPKPTVVTTVAEEVVNTTPATPKPTVVTTVAEEEVNTTPATPKPTVVTTVAEEEVITTHMPEDQDIQVTEEVTPKPVEAPDVEIIEEVDEPLTNKPEDQDPQGFSGEVADMSPDMSPEEREYNVPDLAPEVKTEVKISRGEDQIQPEADVEAVDYKLDSEADEVSLQHQEEAPVQIQGNTEVESPADMVTVGDTRESAEPEPATTEVDEATTPIPPTTTPTPPTTPEPDTEPPTTTEEESSTMSDTT